MEVAMLRTPLIMLLDRDAATLALAEELLRHVGYGTVAYQTAREAHRAIPIEHPDLLILELDLEWYDAGWDLLCLLHKQHTSAALPAIIWSAERGRLRRRLHRRQCQLRAWNCQFLNKPFRRGQLLRAVEQALDERPLRSRAAGE
jgi:CheY-like chemotaxis protein